MSFKSYTWHKCWCEVSSNERTLCESSRGRPESPRCIGSVEGNSKITRLYDGRGHRYVSIKSISGTKCASCTAAAAAASRREMSIRFRTPDIKARSERASAEDSDLGDEAEDEFETIDSEATYKTPSGNIEATASPQDSGGEEEVEDDDGDGSNEVDYNSDDTITRSENVFSEYNTNIPYEEGRREQTPSVDLRASNAPSINHDDHRLRLPKCRVPPRCIKTPSVSSESRCSGDGDQETKERQFRNKSDQKYLRSLGRKQAPYGWGLLIEEDLKLCKYAKKCFRRLLQMVRYGG